MSPDLKECEATASGSSYRSTSLRSHSRCAGTNSLKVVRLLRPAEQEMLDTVAYYDLQVSGLGDAFLDKVDSALADIAENPSADRSFGSTSGAG